MTVTPQQDNIRRMYMRELGQSDAEGTYLSKAIADQGLDELSCGHGAGGGIVSGLIKPLCHITCDRCVNILQGIHTLGICRIQLRSATMKFLDVRPQGKGPYSLS